MDIFEGIPLVENNKEFKEVLKGFKDYDTFYLRSAVDAYHRGRFNKLHSENIDYIDKKHRKSTKSMRQKGQFSGFTWELCSFDLIKSKGYKIDSDDKGPDIQITSPEKTYIECVSVKKGEAVIPDVIPGYIDENGDVHSGVVYDVPDEEILSRITAGIADKYKKYTKKYIEEGFVDPSIPFVIAVNSGFLGSFSQDYLGVPIIVKSLVGFDKVAYDQDGNRYLKYSKSMTLSNGKEIPLNIFSKEGAYNMLSGILWTGYNTLELDGEYDSKIWLIRNPFAKNPLSKEFLKGISYIDIREEGDSLIWSFHPATNTSDSTQDQESRP